MGAHVSSITRQRLDAHRLVQAGPVKQAAIVSHQSSEDSQLQGHWPRIQMAISDYVTYAQVGVVRNAAK